MRRDTTLDYQENRFSNINIINSSFKKAELYDNSHKRGRSPKSSKIDNQAHTIVDLKKALSVVIDTNDTVFLCLCS